VAANDPPTFDLSTSVVSIMEDSLLTTFPGFAINMSVGPPDEAGQIFRFITVAAQSNKFAVQPRVSSSGSLTLQPARDAIGPVLVTVWMQDSGGTNNGGWDTSTGHVFTVNIINTNDPPVIFPRVINSQYINEHGHVTIPLGLFDIETWQNGQLPKDTLSLSVASSLQTLVATGPGTTNVSSAWDATGTNLLVTIHPFYSEYGVARMTFTVSDGTNTTSRTFNLTVYPVNDPPTFTMATNVINWSSTGGIYTNLALFTNVGKGDYKESTQGLGWSIVNTNTALFLTQPTIKTTPDPTVYALTFKPRPGATGGVTLQVTLRDNGGGTNNSVGPVPLRINMTP
jgi:hypothetical protein